jgi:hypothetical protein
MIISHEDFSEALDQEGELRWEKLAFREYLEKRGFFTQSGRGISEGSFKIVEIADQGYHGAKKAKNKYRGIEKVEHCLKNTDVSQCSSKEYKDIMHNLDVISALTYSLKSQLRDL